jgi:TatD DNase family protein
MLIDSHAHLEEIDDLADALTEAKAAGVNAIVAVGTTIGSNQTVLALSREYPGYVYPAVGYHPWEIRAEDVEGTLAFIQEHLSGCVALGEVGLDYKAKVKKALQKQVLSRLLELAVRHGKPAVLHCRYSHDRTLEIVQEARLKEGVFHWYTGSMETLRNILNHGYSISATPALAYSPPHRDAIQYAPLERILLETDSPVAYQGKASRPVDVRRTAELVAEIKGEPLERVAQKTTENARRFFGFQSRS